MIEGATPQAALCLHLISQLACQFTLPAERATALALIRDHLPALGAERFAAIRAAALAMLAAETPLQWSFATMEAGRALVPLHKAESCRIIAALSAKRVA